MAGSITKQFDFIIDSATHAVSKKCDLKLPHSTSFNYFVAESIIIESAGKVSNERAGGIAGRRWISCVLTTASNLLWHPSAKERVRRCRERCYPAVITLRRGLGA
jgi:hypothetical protein